MHSSRVIKSCMNKLKKKNNVKMLKSLPDIFTKIHHRFPVTAKKVFNVLKSSSKLGNFFLAFLNENY